MLVAKCIECGKSFSLESDAGQFILNEGACEKCEGRPATPNPKPGHRIITYNDGRFSMIRLAHGEYVFFSVAKTGIALYRGAFWGLVALPWAKLASWDWDVDKLHGFVSLFGGAEVGSSPFRFAVNKIASFWTIAELLEYIETPSSRERLPVT